MERRMADECIYPGPHTVMSDEHYLPAALGKFEGYEPLRGRVCQRCNTTIGDAVETEFLRTGAIVFFRWLVGISGRDGLPPSPFYRRAAGMPPIPMAGRLPDFDYDVLFEVNPGTTQAFPLRQIVFSHPLLERPRAVPLHDRMLNNPEFLREQLKELGLQSATPIRAFATDEEIPKISEILTELGYSVPDDWAVTKYPVQKIPLVAQVQVSPKHFRAVAKIAFHYTLKMFPELTGLEREFDDIKEFIWSGGDVERFVRQRADQFVQNFGRMRPTKWMHILGVERTYNAIVAHAQFFAGPEILPPPYLIRIGRNPARIDRGREVRAHMFVILDPGASIHSPAASIGRMENAEPAQLIFLPF
jgi:hypothetical protein